MILDDTDNENNNEKAATISTDLPTLSELLIGDSTSLSCYATRAILLYGVENMCFKPSAKVENAFETRTMEVVRGMRNKARAEAEIEARWKALNERIIVSSKSASRFLLEEESEEVQTALDTLQCLGCLANLDSEEAGQFEREMMKTISTKTKNSAANSGLKVARSFLQRLGRRQTPEEARKILVDTGIWHEHQNLDIIRLRIPTEFSQQLLEEAREVEELTARGEGVVDLDEAKRMDLTHLPAYAIDEASTVENDDALSLEILQPLPLSSPNDDNIESPAVKISQPPPMHKRQRIWIHIADPTRYVPVNSLLSNEAKRRATSIYLPTGTIPMFPPSLAAGPLSLRPNTKSPALSIGIMLDEFGGIDPNDQPIFTTSYVNTTRLTYRQVDRVLYDPNEFVGMHGEEEEFGDKDFEGMVEVGEGLRRLQWVADRRLEWRKEGGSLESIGDYDLPDMSVKATATNDDDKNSSNNNDGWKVSVTARKRFTASRIVTELMLLANEAIAMFGRNNDIPLPYRSQVIFPPSDEEVDATPEGPCRSWMAILSTTKTVVSGTAGPHEGLGLDAYVQATSPVRRYADLLVHYQVKAFLRGGRDNLPFSDGSVSDGELDNGESKKEDIIRLAQEGGVVARQLERKANNYWLFEFLRRKAGEPIVVIVLGADRRKTDMYKILLPELGAIIDHTSSHPLQIGSQIEMVPNQDGILIS